MKMLPSASTAMPSGLSSWASPSPLPPNRLRKLATGLVEHLHPGVHRVRDQKLAVLGESEVLDVLELTFIGPRGADIHDVLEIDLCVLRCTRRHPERNAQRQ